MWFIHLLSFGHHKLKPNSFFLFFSCKKKKDRIAGAITEINFLKDAYNRGEYPIRESTDIHAICDLVKSWFRVLPEPVFPPSSYHDVMDAMSKFPLT